MKSGQAFVGFNEAPIDFPPTFKYDVLRTFKRSKRRQSKLNHWKHNPERGNRPTEVEERESEDLEDDDVEDDCEAASLASSIWTSVNSKPGTDFEDNDYFQTSPSLHTLSTPGSKVSITAAARKAKTRFLALLSPISTPSSPTKRPRPKSGHFEPRTPSSIDGNSAVDVIVTDTDLVSLPPSPDPILKASLRRRTVAHATSTKSTNHSDEEDEGDEDRGVYDSSHKKRVPSW
jgi:hypothetical protein